MTRTTIDAFHGKARDLREHLNAVPESPACTCGDDHDCRSTGCDDECPACAGEAP